ncbi:MAG: hypothetical protein FVQ84_08390 [Planctomycetes bacterium]|nr:hypothetical protein [Planctomycetota bacterium]
MGNLENKKRYITPFQLLQIVEEHDVSKFQRWVMLHCTELLDKKAVKVPNGENLYCVALMLYVKGGMEHVE